MALVLLVLSEHIAGNAGYARIRGTAGGYGRVSIRWRIRLGDVMSGRWQRGRLVLGDDAESVLDPWWRAERPERR